MNTVILVVHVMASISIIGLILLQKGKGSAIGASMGGGSSGDAMFGSSGPASFLVKATALVALTFMLTSLYLTYLSDASSGSSVIEDIETVAPISTPAETTSTTPSVPAEATK